MKNFFITRKLALIVMFMGCMPVLALELPFAGRFVQQFSHQTISVDSTSYYKNDGLVYEFSLLSKADRQRIVEEIFTFESRTAYLGRYFAVMLDYSLLERRKRYFSSILSEKKQDLVSRTSHEISPSIFAIYNPLRVGLSYHMALGDEVSSFQELTLRPEDALSLHLQLFFAKIPKTALGVGVFYQYAFDPTLAKEEIAKQYFQKSGLSLHVYFAYYLHFKLGFSWERMEAPFSVERVVAINREVDEVDANNPVDPDAAKGEARLITLPQRTRYMFQYQFIYSFAEELSLFASISQVVYANFESPDFRFKVGINLNFGNDDY